MPRQIGLAPQIAQDLSERRSRFRLDPIIEILRDLVGDCVFYAPQRRDHGARAEIDEGFCKAANSDERRRGAPHLAGIEKN